MIPKLAEEIYEASIQLKKYNSKNLLFKKNRFALQKELYNIQGRCEEILRNLFEKTEYSVEHYELALLMNRRLTECILFLTQKDKNYRNTVERYVWGFHNLPRAFLSIENPMNISVDEAIKYYDAYLD